RWAAYQMSPLMSGCSPPRPLCTGKRASIINHWERSVGKPSPHHVYAEYHINTKEQESSK
ncbi:MAG: hypothetical protein WCH05_10745, partial [Chlorobiaceae bacterium]